MKAPGPTEIAVLADESADPAFVDAYKAAFPDGFPSPSLFAHGYYVNTQAVLLALDKINGDLSDNGAKLKAFGRRRLSTYIAMTWVSGSSISHSTRPADSRAIRRVRPSASWRPATASRSATSRSGESAMPASRWKRLPAPGTEPVLSEELPPGRSSFPRSRRIPRLPDYPTGWSC